MSEASSLVYKLYEKVYISRKYLLEMLEDRGYDTNSLKNYTEDEIKIMLNNHTNNKFGTLSEPGPLDIILEKNKGTANAEKIYVKYRLEDKFKATANLNSQISEIFENILTTKDTLIILNISRVLIKIGAKDKADEEFVSRLYITENYFVQLFGLENFLFNVSRHHLVSKHTILPSSEVSNLLSKYNCTIKNLPTIKRDDPQAKYIGLRPKQVCEITACNPTSGITIKYRYCIN
jgi:DNA-directed RNA polymerase subunit H (RpoH/RPB5)